MLVVGKGDTLNLLWWQAPTILNGHLAQGTKDFDASRVVSEPLADYDKAYETAQVELDPSKQANLFVGMNDLVITNVVHIPEVQRNGVSGANKKLQNLELSAWTSDLWNLMNWTMSS